jgi:hypothetical protein
VREHLAQEDASPVVVLARRLRAARIIGPPECTILGGTFPADRLESFWSACGVPRADMPYAIWETFDALRFRKGECPPATADLERARVFGRAGDLEVRREGSRCFWRVLGAKDAIQKPAGFDAEDFWQTHADVRFCELELSALLWGKYQSGAGCWYDDRVGRAELDYPLDPTELSAGRVDRTAADGARASLTGVQFLDGGQVAFVWWKGVVAHVARNDQEGG